MSYSVGCNMPTPLKETAPHTTRYTFTARFTPRRSKHGYTKSRPTYRPGRLRRALSKSLQTTSAPWVMRGPARLTRSPSMAYR